MLENFTLDSIKQKINSSKKSKLITYIVGGSILAVLLFFTYRQFIWEPSNEKSKDGYWIAQNYIAKDSTDKAIAVLIPFVKKNDGKIGGEMGQYLLATQYMKKGEFKKALTNLEGVSINDTYISVLSIGLQGDCYSELKKYEQALELYMKAADADDNEFTSPMYLFKAGGCADQLDKFDEAIEIYTRIKDDYPTFANSKTIDKYIARASSYKAK